MIDVLGLSGGEAAAAFTIVLVASVVRGYSGFGFSAVLVAGLSFLIDPIEAVPLAIGLEVLASMVQGRSVWDDVDWRRFGALLAAAIVGNPVGVWLLTTVDAEPLRLFTFIMLAVLTLALLSGRRVAVAPTLPVFFFAGVVAGVVNGATAMSGLVLVLVMTSLQVSPAEMRGTLIAYFFASDLVVLGLLFAGSELDVTYGWRILLAVPVMIIGVLIGTQAFRGSSVEQFRRVTLLLLLTVSVVGLARIAV